MRDVRGVVAVSAELKITPKYGARIHSMHTPFAYRKSKGSGGLTITIPPLHASAPIDVRCELALPEMPVHWCQEECGVHEVGASADIAKVVRS